MMTLAVSQDLKSLEAVIADGLGSFVEIGRALAGIRDGGLYREYGYKTFESYCRERWSMSRSYAFRVMGASDVVANWQHSLPPPSTESQARELAKLEPEAQASAWAEAVETAPASGVTAKHVAEVVAKRLPQVEPKSKPRLSKPEPPPVEEEEPEARRAPSANFDALEALREQRERISEFAAWRNVQRQRAKSLPTRAQRMAEFILDGGETALARLGLDWNTTLDAAKRAYRAMCLTAHPDKGGSHEEFTALTRAHDTVRAYLTEVAALKL